MKRIYLPLQGPTGERPKAPSVTGWQSPGYQGTAPPLGTADPGWLGMRCDGLVVIDCDSGEAIRTWLGRIPRAWSVTWTRKTPRGMHFIYRWVPGAPTTNRASGLEHIDIRAGSGGQIVMFAPGYEDLHDESNLKDFDPSWLPEPKGFVGENEDEWSEMPEGVGNNTMAAIAGVLRRVGMDLPTMYATLQGINKLTMTREPMPTEQVRQIATSIHRYEPVPDVTIELADESIEAEDDIEDGYVNMKLAKIKPPPSWLWHPYLPDARLVMLDGEEAIGKGMFCAWAAVNVAAGRPFPGEPNPPARSVIWYTAEDDPYEDVLRRLLAAGYDQAAHAPVYVRHPKGKRPSFPKHIPHLREQVEKWNPRLVVVDPGRSYLGMPDGAHEQSYNNEAVLRPGLESLIHFAQEVGVLILFVHHSNKMSHGTAREKMGGSVAFLQAVRHRVAMASYQEDRVISIEKSNLISPFYNVRSYDVVAVPGTETAKYIDGMPQPEYKGLDHWNHTMKLLADEGGHELQTVVNWVEVAFHYSTLDTGHLAPTAGNIAKDFGVTEEEARAIRAALKEKGVIDKQHRWVGPPPGVRPRREIDHVDD